MISLLRRDLINDGETGPKEIITVK